MKKLILAALIALLLIINSFGIQAQNQKPKLNQIELMKQWIGSWKNESGKDSTSIYDFKPFNKAYEVYYEVNVKGIKASTAKKLIGYDKKNDAYTEAIILDDNPELIFTSIRFKSAHTCEIIGSEDLVNPKNAREVRRIEFKSPGSLIWTHLLNNKVLSAATFKKIKK